jgi:hypothetical protein
VAKEQYALYGLGYESATVTFSQIPFLADFPTSKTPFEKCDITPNSTMDYFHFSESEAEGLLSAYLWNASQMYIHYAI